MAQFTNGIDVYHGDLAPDPETCMAAGISFAYFKMGQGTSLDPAFEERWQAAGEAGWTRGPYFFFDTRHSAEEQVQFCLDNLSLIGTDLPWALDIEQDAGQIGAVHLGSVIHAWLLRIASATGKPPIIYTMPGWWNSAISDASANFLATENECWVAHWTSASQPTLPKGWKEWVIWQWAAGEGGGGPVGLVLPGTTVHVDSNRFAGTHDDLVNHFKLAG